LNLANKERVANQCVCCGSNDLFKSPAILMPFVAARTFGWYPTEINDDWGLKTIQNGMAYSICNSLCCKECNHLFLDIRFTDAEMSRLYQDYRGQDYVDLRESFEPGYVTRNQILNNGVSFLDQVEDFLTPYIVRPLTVLDWGGDTGVNTPFKEIAEKLDVYDISGKEVLNGMKGVSLEEAQKNKYKLIVCSQVLEHVSFPADVINSIKKCMDGDSILYIELPCEDLVMSSSGVHNLAIKKKHWHEHINFYTEESLQALMKFCGLKLENIQVSKVLMNDSTIFIYQVVAMLP